LRNLNQWLAWQETLHPEEIELGLERISRVAERINLLQDLEQSGAKIVTVAGTNGKGSSVAFLDSIARAAGLRVGTYTSPHLLQYNERVKINGKSVSDQQLCSAFEKIDAARGEDALTYFEFGTLAALEIFRDNLDLIILEVGLGGRLDAVNIVDSSVTLVTTVDLDHQAWLGNSREEIGREKAGIARKDRVLVVGEYEPPNSLLSSAQEIGAKVHKIGKQFCFVVGEGCWSWMNTAGIELYRLPYPKLYGEIQIQNCAAVLEVLYQLGILQTIVASENKADILAKGILSATIAGRFQQLQLKGVDSSIDAILDVAHNPQAARVVVDMVKQLNISDQQQTITVIAMLKDKEMLSVVEELSAITDHWMVAGVAESSRGASAEELQKVVELSVKNRDEGRDEINVEKFRSVEDAFIASINLADNLDKSARILVLGSFYSVAAVLNAEKIGTIELRI